MLYFVCIYIPSYWHNQLMSLWTILHILFCIILFRVFISVSFFLHSLSNFILYSIFPLITHFCMSFYFVHNHLIDTHTLCHIHVCCMYYHLFAFCTLFSVMILFLLLFYLMHMFAHISQITFCDVQNVRFHSCLYHSNKHCLALVCLFTVLKTSKCLKPWCHSLSLSLNYLNACICACCYCAYNISIKRVLFNMIVHFAPRCL